MKGRRLYPGHEEAFERLADEVESALDMKRLDEIVFS